MNVLDLDGLDGSNPLHALAAFGALLATEDIDPGAARLGWSERGGRFRPRLATSLEETAWTAAIAGRVREAGAVKEVDKKALQRRVTGLKAEEKKLGKLLKEARGRAREEARGAGLKGPAATAHVSERLREIEAQGEGVSREREEAERALSAALGFGMAHLGELISVPVDVFRLHARHGIEHDAAIARQLAALGSDGCLKKAGTLEETPYSFSNNNSGQMLLKDFRGVAAACTAEKVVATLVRGEPLFDQHTSLNWDPLDYVSGAYIGVAPRGKGARKPATTDAVTNSLGYLGLGLVPCFPGARGIEATAFARGFRWPVWQPLLPAPVVGALLAERFDPGEGGARSRRARGVLATFHSAIRKPPGSHSSYFAPSRAV